MSGQSNLAAQTFCLLYSTARCPLCQYISILHLLWTLYKRQRKTLISASISNPHFFFLFWSFILFLHFSLICLKLSSFWLVRGCLWMDWCLRFLVGVYAVMLFDSKEYSVYIRYYKTLYVQKTSIRLLCVNGQSGHILHKVTYVEQP